jgi:hypothetical protein
MSVIDEDMGGDMNGGSPGGLHDGMAVGHDELAEQQRMEEHMY